MIQKLIILAAAVWLLQTGLLAQKKVYSLQDVLQKTVQQYPSLSARKYEIERQELRKNLVKKEQLPEVNVQSQQSYGSYQGVAGAFCRAEMPSLNDLYKKLKDDDRFVFLFMNEDDDKFKAQQYLGKNGFSIPLFHRLGNVPNEIFSGTLQTTIVLN